MLFRSPESLDRFVDVALGSVVQTAEMGFAGALRDRHAHDHTRLRAQVVDDDERAREDEQRIRDVEALRRRVRQPLDETHDVVPEVADRATPERTELRNVYWFVRGDERAQIRERIGGVTLAVPSTLGRPVFDHAIA